MCKHEYSDLILTTELIGVKVSWPFATVHGRPADFSKKLKR